ncbi:MAG: hypothetical protein LBM60_03735 [Clostridium sp.]|jgi:hypothetical protein|nr:hypothetical protein [Clostridium sp.]
MKRNIFGRKNQDELNRRDLFSTESTELNRIDLEYEEVYADEASMYEQLITSDEDLYGSDDTNYRDEMSDESIYETEISDESIYEIEAIDKTVYETEASEAMAHETAVSDETFYETDAIDESVYEDEYFTQEQYETDGGTYDSYEADDAITAQNLEIYEADDAFEVQDLNIYNEDEVQSKPRSYHAVREDRSERRFGVLDMVLLGAGGLLLVFAVLTAVSYFQKQSYQRELQAFLTVGRAIDHIDTIGQEGILGVETLLRNTQEPDTPPLTTQEPDDEYDEIDYSRQVTVSLSLVSIQKDLKIKFIDRSTGKLISNVPFVVEIEDPDGAKKSWSDVDLDGIIYEKNIKAGIYKVQLQQLSGDKYRNYVLPGGRESVDVRRDLVYEKVDVSNEIKGESEINVAKEDTEQKETVVESTLTDTVPWVESTRVAQNYIELPKDQILKPEDVLTQALDGLVVRRVEKINRVLMDQQDVSPGDGENPGVVFPDISLTVANTTLSVVTAKTTTTEITATQLPANSSLSYTITPTDSTIAAAELLQNHKTLQIYAKAPGTVSFTITAKLTTYEGNLVPDTVDNPAPTATAQIEVIVTDPMTLSLNYPKINVYVGEPFTITSTVNHVRPYAPQSDITTSLLT